MARKSIWHFVAIVFSSNEVTKQCAKKVVSDGPGLVDFAIRLE